MQSMLSIFPTIATILGALCFCTVDLPAQSLDDAKPSSVSTGAPDKGDPGVKVGFFSDEVVQDSELEGIPEDLFFDRYVPIMELAEAWETTDSGKLADLAIQAEEGKRILLRERRGISNATLWSMAIRAAEVQGNTDVMTRLASAADRYALKAESDRLQTALKLAGESRAVEVVAINPATVSVEDFTLLQDYSKSIDKAALRGDTRYLQDVKYNSDRLFPNAEHRKVIEGLLNGPLSHPAETSPDWKSVIALDTLLADSRGWGIKIPTPHIPTPNIPDPTKAIREAAERAAASAKAEARRAAEYAQQRADAARRAAQAESERAAEVARNAAERARAEAQNAGNQVSEGAKHVLSEAEKATQELIDNVRRWWLPIVGKYIAYLDSQGDGRYKSLSPQLKNALARQYPGVSLDSVRYATNIDTVHGQGITVGDKIFFPSNINPEGDFSDLHWLLHELEHVGQYRAHGGVEPFLIKYLVNGGIKMASNGSFNVHDSIGLEEDAENKAERIANDVWGKLNGASLVNRTEGAREFLSGTWQTDGRTATFANGICTIQTSSGNASFRYSFDASSGNLIGTDGNGVTTTTRVNRVSENSFEWISPSGRRNYVRIR